MTFSSHVDKIVSCCNSRLYLLQQLKILGVNTEGLKKFFTANIRSIITYASPSWFFLLSEGDKNKLKKIQRTASRFILPELSYDDRLAILELPSVCDFIITLGERHFNKIASDPQHPLFSRVHFNTCSRISSRRNTIFRPVVCRTQKRAKSFFPFFMSYLNKW